MGRSDLEDVMWEAWKKVWPMLKADPDELRARLARRRSKMYLRPMRAHCLAVRASDRRINSYDAITIPDYACYPGRPDLHRQHTVTLDKRLMVQVCEPVELHPMGETAKRLSARLGCNPASLLPLRKNGTLRVRYRMDTKFLHPEPRAGCRKNPAIYHADGRLDPSARSKRRPDAIWGPLWAYYASSLPDDFAQDVVRVPRYHAGPHGPSHFWGWRWICPGCKEEVRTIYLPRKPSDWGRYVGLKVEEGEEVPAPLECFGCAACHGVSGFSRVALTRSWGDLILHLSGGLLYGREVRRPDWLTPLRRNKHSPHRCAHPQRDRLERLLVGTDLSSTQIAQELGCRRGTANREACKIYKRHGVHSREELRSALPPSPGTPGEGQGEGA